jgi:hypothetical protein
MKEEVKPSGLRRPIQELLGRADVELGEDDVSSLLYIRNFRQYDSADGGGRAFGSGWSDENEPNLCKPPYVGDTSFRR